MTPSFFTTAYTISLLSLLAYSISASRRALCAGQPRQETLAALLVTLAAQFISLAATEGFAWSVLPLSGAVQWAGLAATATTLILLVAGQTVRPLPLLALLNLGFTLLTGSLLPAALALVGLALLHRTFRDGKAAWAVKPYSTLSKGPGPSLS
jgi:hypothetical protein